jgi:hypothetical protein
MHEGGFVPEYLRLTIPENSGAGNDQPGIAGDSAMLACDRRALMHSVEDLRINRRTSFFSDLIFDDLQQEGGFPNPLCHISDEIRHTPD